MPEPENTFPRSRFPRTSRALGLSLFAVATAFGCSPSRPARVAPPVDAGQVATAAMRASQLDAPYRLVFEWSSTEPNRRLSGEGVARVEPPYLARLDLFSDNGERVAAAALDGDDLRVTADAQTEIPPAPLLWGALGVFRPAVGSGLVGGSMYPDGEVEVRYLTSGGGEVRFRLKDNRIERIEVLQGGRTREELTLVQVEGERFPRRATYRDLQEVRELRITLESVENVESYPTDIWNPQF